MTTPTTPTIPLVSNNKQLAATILAIVLSIVSILGAFGVITPAQNVATQTLIQQLMQDMNLTYAQVTNALNQPVGSTLYGLAGPYSYMISHPLGDAAITAMKNGTTGAWDYWSTSTSAVLTNGIGNMTNGMTMFFTNGTYYPSTSTVVNQGNISFVGSNEKGAIFVNPRNFNNVTFNVTASNVNFEHLGFNGNIDHQTTGALSDAINFTSTSGDDRVEDCFFMKFLTSIIVNGADTMILGNEIGQNNNATYPGSFVFLNGGVGDMVSNNVMYSGDYCLNIVSSTDSIISDNRINNAINVGIAVTGATADTFEGNHVYASGTTNLDLYGTNTNNNFVGNTFSGGGTVITTTGNSFTGNVGFVTQYYASAVNVTATTWTFSFYMGSGAAWPTQVFASFNSTQVTAYKWVFNAGTLTVTGQNSGTTDQVVACYINAVYQP